MKALLCKFLRNESGATAIEYGLLIACIGLAATFGMKSFSAALYNVYVDVDNAVQEHQPAN
ncbi:pilus assembly protein Flp/PilA [Novosphingobium hassiacum]|uniref:Pilus assembly protein Flp/PilA n=1 Tax=Novosphingobium hassiacum TaxID=173676 RepID=A0A7W5ZY33_9SPHN|nr:pilus assembly protein Flp/PilA [Novosphingobium hassiacum]